MTAAEIAERLHGKKVGATYMALCPAHDDRNPSLSLRDENGKMLVHCFAGCDQRAVIAALKALGLWPEGNGSGEMRWGEWRDGIRYPTHWGTPVCAYDYHDALGSLLYSVVRFDPKNFRPGYFDDHRWNWQKHPHQVLYHLPEVLESLIVFVTEGEKDADKLREYGFVATTNAGGAKAPWLDSYSESLRGRDVILIPDNDRPGWERVERIARRLLGVAARIRVFDLPTGTKDISDWFAAGHSESELVALLEATDVRSA